MRELRILNLGAGVQSTTVYLLAREHPERWPIDYAIFADTQDEPAAVYDHLAWLRSLPGGAPILVRSAGKLSDDLVRGRHSTGQSNASIPAYTRGPAGIGITRRQCSKEYKTQVVHRTIRRDILALTPRARWPKDLALTQIFGISRDEAGRAVRIAKRIAEEMPATFSARFPLIELGWTRGDCQRWLASRVPHQVPRSACVFCPYHSNAEWRRQRDEDPVSWARSIEVDDSLRRKGTVFNRTLNQPLFLHRSAVPLGRAAGRGRPRRPGPAADEPRLRRRVRGSVRRMNVWDYICKLTARIAALQAALREQYELAHGGLPGDHDESSCDDRCRRARQLIEEPQP